MQHQHLLCDLSIEDTSILERVGPWPQILLGIAERIEATVIDQRFHQFEPWGVTGFLLLAESHISVHTWPEENLAALDIFACADIDTDSVLSWLRDQLHPSHEQVTLCPRGGQKVITTRSQSAP